MKILESNCETGEITERDMTPEEIEQQEAKNAALLAELQVGEEK